MMKIFFSTILVFSLLSLSAQTNFQKTEWFIDADPGFNNANRVNFTSNSDIAEWNIALSGLEVGVHYLGVRVLDANGIWSHTLTRSFLILPPTLSDITLTEWFIDEDPGFGQANPIQMTTDTAAWEIDLSGLATGVHYLHVRTQQASGAWSHTLTRSFLVAAEGESPIQRIDYRYQDELGNELPFSYELEAPRHYIDLDFIPDTTNLVGGTNYELCFSVVTVAGAASEQRCLEFTTTDIPSSVSNSEPATLVKVYPNPSSDWINIELPKNMNLIKWSIVNANGQYQKQQKATINTQNFHVDITTLSSGHYALILESDSLLVVRYFVVH